MYVLIKVQRSSRALRHPFKVTSIMNKIWLIGHVGQKPEARGAESQVAAFSLAVKQWQKGGEKTTIWLRCVAFGKAAQNILTHVDKGSHIAVTGSIKYKTYEREGLSKQEVEISVDSWEFCGSKQKRNEIGNQGPAVSWSGGESWS